MQVISINGATGSGKSRLASLIASKHGIQQITTDHLREVLRFCQPDNIFLHANSDQVPLPDGQMPQTDKQIVSCWMYQSALVLEASVKAFTWAIADNGCIVVEGVHLYPGWSKVYLPQYSVLECILDIPSDKEHQDRIASRGRIGELDHYNRLRMIGLHMTKTAKEQGTLILPNDLDRSLDVLAKYF